MQWESFFSQMTPHRNFNASGSKQDLKSCFVQLLKLTVDYMYTKLMFITAFGSPQSSDIPIKADIVMDNGKPP